MNLSLKILCTLFKHKKKFMICNNIYLISNLFSVQKAPRLFIASIDHLDVFAKKDFAFMDSNV